jgi:hypothetical protein
MRTLGGKLLDVAHKILAWPAIRPPQAEPDRSLAARAG